MDKPRYQSIADQLAGYGRYGDTELVHMNREEVRMLEALSPTGKLTRNPETGQPEAWLNFLVPILGSFLGNAALGSTMGTVAASALGSAAATTLYTGDLEQGVMAGLTGYGLGSAMSGLAGAGAAAGAGATDAASSAALSELGTNAANSALSQAGQSVSTVPWAPADLSASGIAGAGQSFVPYALQPAPTDVPATTPSGIASVFQNPQGFVTELSKPSSFLPIYVGETGRQARADEIAMQAGQKDYEKEEERKRRRALGQLAGVYDSVRNAYPGVGY